MKPIAHSHVQIKKINSESSERELALYELVGHAGKI